MKNCIHNFRNKILSISGEDVGKCIQCGKCSAGCPLTPEMELLPNQILELIKVNEVDIVLKSNVFWFCVSCQTCSVRCPESIDIAKIMNTLRKLNLEKDIPKPKKIITFNKIFLKSIMNYGRIYELGLVLKYNLISGQPFKDVTFAPAIFLKRKILIFPHRLKEISFIRTLIRKSSVLIRS